MATLLWSVNRFLVPVIAAAVFVATRWGQDNIAFVIAVPPLILVFRMAASPSQGLLDPGVRVRGGYACHAADVLSLVFLMAFEIAVAIQAEARVRALPSWAGLVATCFVPYVLLSALARHYLIRANTLPETAGADGSRI